MKECAQRLLAGEPVRSIVSGSERARRRVGERRRVVAAELAADARLAAHQRPAGASRRDRRQGRLARRSSAPEEERGSVRCLPIRSGGRTRPRAATCWVACSSAVIAVSGWSRGRGREASAAMPARAGQRSRAAARPTSMPTRSSGSSPRRCIHRARLAPIVQRAFERQQRSAPDAQRWLDEVEQAAGTARELAELLRTAARSRSRSGWLPASRSSSDAATPASSSTKALAYRACSIATSATATDYAGDWESLDLSQQHAIVAALVDRVVVGPARRGYNRFDESRLTPALPPLSKQPRATVSSVTAIGQLHRDVLVRAVTLDPRDRAGL